MFPSVNWKTISIVPDQNDLLKISEVLKN